MRHSQPAQERRGLTAWVIGWLVLVALQLASVSAGDQPIGSALLLFWIVVIAASGCVVTAAWLIARGWRDDSAELGLIGAFAFAVSILPLVHGLTVPGVVYGDNTTVLVAAMLAVPVAVLAAAPLVAPKAFGFALRHWRRWVVANLTVHVVLAVALLLRPDALPAPRFGDPLPTALALFGLAGTVVISARHLRLYRISRHPAVLVVSLALASIAAGNLVWLSGSAMTPAFWLAHALDIVGVFGATVVGAIAFRRRRTEVDVFRPLTLRHPLDALEYGLDPVVREFVTDLGRKDEVTREHVKRTAEAAIEVGERLGLSPVDLRNVGIGALLHDIGKIRIPDGILTKPGKLTDDEFAVMRTHAAIGAEMLAGSPVLADAAQVVLHHHERIDGRGYPTGLAGEEIPLLARIVSVCDAWDAMVHQRHYRAGMTAERARSIFDEHAGTQWDPVVVAALLTALDARSIPEQPTVLASLGTSCSCVADLPAVAAV